MICDSFKTDRFQAIPYKYRAVLPFASGISIIGNMHKNRHRFFKLFFAVSDDKVINLWYNISTVTSARQGKLIRGIMPQERIYVI